MSFWSRITYVFRGDCLNHEINEEFAAHIEEGIAAGNDPTEVRRTFGFQLRLREQSREKQLCMTQTTRTGDEDYSNIRRNIFKISEEGAIRGGRGNSQRDRRRA